MPGGAIISLLTDEESQTTAYAYNNLGQKTSETYPDHTGGSSGSSTYGIVEFAYDPAGHVQLRTDQNGDTVTYTFDLAGRMTQRDYRTKAKSPTGTIADSDSFTFDRSSRMLTGVSGRYSNTVTMAYGDNDGRLEDESLTIASQTYTVGRSYDGRGMLSQLDYPDGGYVQRTYTDRGQLDETKYKGTSGGTLYTEDTRTYDAGGRLSTSAYRNGVTTTYAYRSSGGNKDNQLDSISFSHPGGASYVFKTHTYTWDANKNKTKETIASGSGGGNQNHFSFDTTLGADPDGYDDEDRLVYYKRSSQANPQTWTLTAVGDWSSWSNFGTSQSRTHGAAHEILTAGSSPNNAISHDVKGNITEIPTNVSSPARKLFWDFDNRLTGVDTTGDSTPEVTYSYDALGRRVWRTESSATVVYVSAGQQVVCDYPSGAAPSSTPTYRYVWGDYVDEPILRRAGSTYHYYHHNQQFSTIGLTNSSGVVVERYGYTAYGQLSLTSGSGGSRSWSTNSNRYLYTGREWDDSVKLFYFRARWYEPLLGGLASRNTTDSPRSLSLYQMQSLAIPGGRNRLSFSLCMSVTTPPKTIGDCGGSEAEIKWSFASLEADGDLSKLNGVIVQEVTISYEVRECDGDVQLASIGPVTYYEAWVVKGGAILALNHENRYEPRGWDKFEIKDAGEETRGAAEAIGNARFMPNYELIFPPWIGPGGIGHWKGAGRLPTLYPGPPDGWRRGFSRRALIAKWICCKCDQRQTTDIGESWGWADHCGPIMTIDLQ